MQAGGNYGFSEVEYVDDGYWDNFGVGCNHGVDVEVEVHQDEYVCIYEMRGEN